MGVEELEDRCTVTECLSAEIGSEGPPREDSDLLSVVVFHDQPFDAVALDEALFSLAIQDYEHLEVVLVLPECGPAVHQWAERMMLAQAWPSQTRGRVVSVATRSSRMIAADLLNAGVLHATGRYVAFLHHQDLVYQHAYPALIGRLRSTDAAVAFGGVRVAAHARAYRHWMVTSKDRPKMPKARMAAAVNGRAAIHSFVMDRDRLPGDYHFAHNPDSRLAVALFLSRLALHEKADFALAGEKIVESRTPPPPSPSVAAGLGRLPSADELLASLINDDFYLKPDAVCIKRLLADAIGANSTEAQSAAS